MSLGDKDAKASPVDKAHDSKEEKSIEPEGGDTSAWRLVRALKEPNYRYYFMGQGISLIGTWMQNATLGWVAFSFAEQSRWPAWVSASQLLPSVILGPLAGRFIDRLPKRKLILITQSILALLGLALALASWADWLTPGRLIVWAVVSGIVLGIDLPARLAYLVDLAGRGSLPNAVALNSFQFNLARAIGPSIAALVMVQWGAPACFALNALTYTAVLFALFLNDAPGLPHPRLQAKGGTATAAIPSSVWGTVILAGLVSGLGWPVLALAPGYASQVLHQGPETYAYLLGGIGVGALCACVWVAAERSESQRRFRMDLAMLSVGCGLSVLAQVERMELALLAAPMVGLGMVGFLATAQTMVQMQAPASQRGFILGVWTGVLSGSLPLGNFLAGPLADEFGVAFVLKMAGLGILFALGIRVAIGWAGPYRGPVRL